MSLSTSTTYEQAFTELEDIVEKLNSGELPLQDTVTLYTRGKELAAFCQKLLDTAELGISKLDDAGNTTQVG
jgi:exodeoxyribonuclease VII small subunit